MHTAPRLPSILVQPPQIPLLILAREEARLAIVAALNNVQREVGQREPGAAGRGGATRSNNECMECSEKPWSVPYYAALRGPNAMQVRVPSSEGLGSAFGTSLDVVKFAK